MFPFTTIIVTNPDDASALAAQELLDRTLRRQLQTLYPSQTNTVRIISTCDPFGARCGSGGGTLAALELLLVDDKLNDDGDHPIQQQQETVLCLHAGGDSSRCPLSMILGKAWTSLPSSRYRNPTMWLIHQLELLFHRSKVPRGSLIVAATDCLISFGQQLQQYDDDGDDIEYEDDDGTEHFPEGMVDMWTVLGVAVPAPLNTAKNHGVYILPDSVLPSSLSSTKIVKEGTSPSSPSSSVPPFTIATPVDVWQKPTLGQLVGGRDNNTTTTTTTTNVHQSSTKNLSVTPSSPSFDVNGRDGKQAWIDVGIVIFFPKAFETLLHLADGILSRCTRRGLEAAYNTDEVSNTTSSSYLSLEAYAKQNALKIDLYTDILHNIPRTRQSATATVSSGSDHHPTIKEALSNLLLKVLVAPNGSFLHLGTTQELVDFITFGANSGCGLPVEASGGGTIDLNMTLTVAKALDMNSRFLAWIDDDGHDHGSQRHQHYPASNGHSDFCSNVALCSTFPGNKKKKNDVGEDDAMSDQNAATTTTTIGKFSFVEHCDLEDFASVSVGDHCMLSGWRNFRNTAHKSADDATATKNVVESVIIPQSLSVQLIPILQRHDDVNYNNMESSSEGGKERFVYMVLGTKDGTKTPLLSGTIYGIPFSDFIGRTGVTVVDLGFDDGSLHENDCLWSAKIHPIVHPQESSSISFSSLFGWIENARTGNISTEDNDSLRNWLSSSRVSLKDLHGIADASKEWTYRNALEEKVAKLHRDRSVSKISTLLSTRCQDEPCDVRWLMDLHDGPTAWEALGLFIDSLGTTACDELEHGNYDICGRAFMLASATLADFDATGRGGQLEGDGGNVVATNCSELVGKLKLSSTKPMANSERIQIVEEILRQQRSCLQARGCQSCRVCSEIMEHLALVMVEFTIADSFRRFLDPTFPDKIHITRVKEPVYNNWILTTAPARVDLAGGWSDTPPICYEYGGAVTGMAVLVDDKYPLCCRSRILTGATGMLLKTEIRDMSSGDLLACNNVEIGCVDDLNDFRDPSSSCALLKASLVCLGIATEEQLQDKHDLQCLLNKFCSSDTDVRIEIVTTSLLGMGTGMGTSSILGGCILQTIAECVGIGKMQDEFLIHSVLMLEQLLSSGGGWQDQAHGILPGVKTIRSLPPKIPLKIQIEELHMPETAISALEGRLLFAYTGKTRLAKNILQQVLRRWSRRTTEIVNTVKGLVDVAEKMRTAILNESWHEVGECLHESFKLKCTMAGEDSGAEPELVKLFAAKLMAHAIIQGAMLCGAGGGGFLLLVLSEGVDRQVFQSFFESEVLPLNKDFKDFSFHTCRIAPLGLTTTIMDEKALNSDSFNLSWQRNHPRHPED